MCVRERERESEKQRASNRERERVKICVRLLQSNHVTMINVICGEWKYFAKEGYLGMIIRTYYAFVIVAVEVGGLAWSQYYKQN